jgi:hypothetical protein
MQEPQSSDLRAEVLNGNLPNKKTWSQRSVVTGQKLAYLRTVYVHTHTHTHTCLHTYMHKYIHTYKHTYIHTYKHTRTGTGIFVYVFNTAFETRLEGCLHSVGGFCFYLSAHTSFYRRNGRKVMTVRSLR